MSTNIFLCLCKICSVSSTSFLPSSGLQPCRKPLIQQKILPKDLQTSLPKDLQTSLRLVIELVLEKDIGDLQDIICSGFWDPIVSYQISLIENFMIISIEVLEKNVPPFQVLSTEMMKKGNKFTLLKCNNFAREISINMSFSHSLNQMR